METLCEAKEEDLRLAGLKMGDIIKIRQHVEARRSSDDTNSLVNSLLSSESSLNDSLSSSSDPELGSEHKCKDPAKSINRRRDQEFSKQAHQVSYFLLLNS